jgi:hypothetical protein
MCCSARANLHPDRGQGRLRCALQKGDGRAQAPHRRRGLRIHPTDIFTLIRLGVAQYCGATVEGASEETAAGEALGRMAAVEAVIADSRQASPADSPLSRVEWLLDFLVNRAKSNMLAIQGHPDPRMARWGLGKEGSL